MGTTDAGFEQSQSPRAADGLVLTAYIGRWIALATPKMEQSTRTAAQRFGRRDTVDKGNGPKSVGHRRRHVVEGQHIMQASSDIFLGWSQEEASGRHYSSAMPYLKTRVSERDAYFKRRVMVVAPAPPTN